MISKERSPAAWAGMMYELEDAREHLAALIAEMNSGSDYAEIDLRIDLGHVFAHLNRAWHRRAAIEELDGERWTAASKFPTDLDPT